MRFSIFICTKDRPSYLHDSVLSVLLQEDVVTELVVSNNGANPETRGVVEGLKTYGNIHYIEQPNVLNMPTHWEAVSRQLKGEYIIALTDRSVLRQGALRKLAAILDGADYQLDAVTWPWDSYHDNLKNFVPFNKNLHKCGIVEPKKILSDFAKGLKGYPYSLPRGLNSCVHRSVIDRIRSVRGGAFMPMSPDFSFAFSVLCIAENLYYESTPFLVFQGLKVSGGGAAYAGDCQPYLETLDEDGEFIFVPIKDAFVQNSIHEDFLRVANAFKNDDALVLWDRKSYYLQCIEELQAKKVASLLSKERIMELEESINKALANEPAFLRLDVLRDARCQHSLRHTLAEYAKRILFSNVKLERMMRSLIQSGRYFPTALEAAGFKKDIRYYEGRFC